MPELDQSIAGPPGWLAATLRSAASAGLSFPAPREPSSESARVNGLSLRYLDWGGAGLPDLLFIHGFAQQAHSWDFAALALQHMFHVVALDLRGHGESEWSPEGEYSFDALDADVSAFIDAIGLKRPAICGLSLGGALACSYASKPGADLSALIVVESAPESLPGGRDSIRRFTESAAKSLSMETIIANVKAYTPLRSDEQVRGSLMHSVRPNGDGTWSWKYDPEIRRLFERPSDTTSRWKALERIAAPTLFTRGADSDMTTDEIFERMRRAVPGSRVVTVPDAGHRVAGDNPKAFNEAALSFLAENIGAGASSGEER